MDAAKLISDHWHYIEQVIRQEHQMATITLTLDEYIKRLEFHYKTAFEHGLKHKFQDIC